MTLLNCPSSLLSSSLFVLMTFFSRKKFLLQLQCPLFNPTSILFHRGLHLVILPSTQKKKYMIISRKSPSFLTSLPPFSKMVLNLKESILSNTLVLLSPLIYHGLLISNLSALKLVKPLEPSTVTSISMLLFILFSLCIALLSFSFFLLLLCLGPTCIFHNC